MSFMSGFATGFGDAYQKGAARRAEAKQDLIKIAYDNYMRKKDQWDKDSKADKEAVSAAKAIASQVGAPEGAWTYAYNALKQGDGYDTVLKMMNATIFASDNTPSSPEEDPALSAASQQTKDSGMIGTSKSMDPNAKTNDDVVDDPGVLGSNQGPANIFDPINMQKQQMSRANQAVATQAGTTPEEMQRISGGYQPDIPQTNVKVTGFDPSRNSMSTTSTGASTYDPTKSLVGTLHDGSYVDIIAVGDNQYKTPDGKVISGSELDGVPMTKETRTNIDTLLNQIGGDSKQVAQNRITAVNLASQLTSLDSIVQKNRDVITRSKALSEVVNEGMNELASLADQIPTMSSSDFSNKEQAITSKIGGLLQNVGLTTQDSQAFASQAVPIIFQLARLNNGSGNLSGADVQAAERELLSTNDASIFSKNVKQIANTMLGKSNEEASLFMKTNPNVQNAKRYGQGNLLNGLFGDAYDALAKDAKEWIQAPVNGVPNNGDVTGRSNPDIQNKGQTSDAAVQHGGTPQTKLITPDFAKKQGMDPQMAGKTVRVYPDGYVEVEGTDY